MAGSPTTALAPILAILVVLAIDGWVYMDAKARAELGYPVIYYSGNLRIETPITWFIGCLVLWIIFFPPYIISRGRGS